MTKLLVVDDDVIDAMFVKRAFSDVGRNIEITHVMDADVATVTLSCEPFDYVLLDLNMTGTNGVELLKRIRMDERTAVLPVIMLTSSSRKSSPRETRSHCGVSG